MCVDQGFPRSGDASFILVGPISRRQARRLAANLRQYLLTISNVYVSLRQASEWGMRGLQGTFPRFKKRLPGNAFKRSLVIKSIVFIHNFRTEIVGLNQIRTVFDPEYERYISLHGYDRIRRYYFNNDDVYDDWIINKYLNYFSFRLNYYSKFYVIHSFSVFGEKRNVEIAIP